VQDLFGNDTSTAQQVDSKRSSLRASIRRIHGMIVALPAQADATTQGIADRIKRAKATELSKIASELNRQEIQDLQAKAHRGVYPAKLNHLGLSFVGKHQRSFLDLFLPQIHDRRGLMIS
jgi:hypothetical protein